MLLLHRMPKTKALCNRCKEEFHRFRALRRHRCPAAAVPPPPPPDPTGTQPVQEERAQEVASLTTGAAPEAASGPLAPPSQASPYLEIEAPQDDDLDEAIAESVAAPDAPATSADSTYQPLSPPPWSPSRSPLAGYYTEPSGHFPFPAIAYQSTQTDDIGRVDTASQTVAELSPLRRVRRQVLQEGSTHNIQLVPVRRNPQQTSASAPDVPSGTWDTRLPRPQCDCTRCVRHLLDLIEGDRGQQPVTQARLRYHSLPGMNLRAAAATELRRLQEGFAARAVTRRLACGCRSCVVHRQFVAVWRAALDINRTDSTREPRPQ